MKRREAARKRMSKCDPSSPKKTIIEAMGMPAMGREKGYCPTCNRNRNLIKTERSQSCLLSENGMPPKPAEKKSPLHFCCTCHDVFTWYAEFSVSAK